MPGGPVLPGGSVASDVLLGPLRSVAGASGHDARQVNRRSVLHAIASGTAITRADLARCIGLARPTVSSLVDELTDDGLVIELGPGTSAGGKRPTLLGIDHAARQTIAIDASARPMTAVRTDLAGSRLAAATAPDLGDPTTTLIALVDELAGSATAPLAGVGIGTPGLVQADGTVIEAANLDWHDHPLRALVEAATGLPVWVANDADAAALAEFARLPSERDGLAVIRIGDGIGAGLVIAGRPYQGPRAGAGEIGHLVVDPGGMGCACGNVGCLETVASLPAIDRMAVRLAGDGHVTDDHDPLGSDAPAVHRALDHAAGYLGAVLAHLVAILDVSDVVLAVERTGYAEWLAAEVAAVIRARLLPRIAETVDVRPATDPAALVTDGAHALVLAGALGMVRP